MRRLNRDRQRARKRAKKAEASLDFTGMELSHRPVVLFHASLDRLKESRRAFENHDYTLAMYLGGVAVECVLQAIALRSGSGHDARHDLSQWLGKCPQSIQNSIKEESAGAWSLL